MGLFRKKMPEPELPPYEIKDYEPVIRSSICTGEKVACMRERESGRLHEIMLIRTEEDLARFCRAYGVDSGALRTVY